MASSEQTIRVTARGEFSQLENGLKNLQKDLKSVLGEIDKGARKGGFFDDTQLRALDVYRTRFKSTMDELNREFQKQNDTIDQLYKQQSNASKDMQKQIQNEIDRREKLLDKIRRQMMATEDLYGKRNRESDGYGRPHPADELGQRRQSAFGRRRSAPNNGEDDEAEEGISRPWKYGGGSSGGGGMLGGLGGGLLSKVLGVGGFMMGLAGLSGISSLASQSYQLAYNSQVAPLNLAQRLRGNGYGGTAKNMWDTIGRVGRSNSMGYTSEESWNYMDMISRQAGAQNPNDLQNGLMFGRAYGLDTGETAQSLGAIRQLGGTSSTSDAANMFSDSVTQSGMAPRILEVMQTSAGLLASMNTTLKDNGAKQLLAYQTTLDSIGNAKGMQQLTGAQGANVIQGLGGIYNPSQSNPWQWMGIQALQQYNPGKYGKMGLYDLQTNFEDGLLNTDNLPAMSQYLKKESGGNTNTFKRMLQQWLQQGGYNATKQQVNDLYSATDGMTAFDSSKINGIIGQLTGSGGANATTSNYQQRMNDPGQKILDTNARFEKDLEDLGQPLVTAVQALKGTVTNILDGITGENGALGGLQKTLGDIYTWLKDHWVTAAEIGTAVGAALLAKKLLGGGGGSGGGGSSKGGGGSGGGGGILPVIGGKVGTAAKGWGIASLIMGALGASGDPTEDNKAAKDAGLKDKPIWFDRFVADTVNTLTFGLVSKKDTYSALNPENTIKPLQSFMDKYFPESPKSKEQKTAENNIMAGKTADGKSYRHLTWDEYADPSNWGKGTVNDKSMWNGQWWQDQWNKFFGQGGSKEDLVKAGVVKPNAKYYQDQNEQNAMKSLQTLGDSGKVNIVGLTTFGKNKLQELADKGLIALKKGADYQVTTISGFTDAGKKSLQKMADQGLIDISGFSTNGTATITALSSEGQKKLEDLKKSGSIDISNFHTESSTAITKMTTDGAAQLTTLQKNGSLSMTSMDTTTTKKLESVRSDTATKMDDIKTEHIDLKDKLAGADGIHQKWSDDTKKIHSTWSDSLIGDNGIFSKWADAAKKIFQGISDFFGKIFHPFGDGDVGINPNIQGGGMQIPSGVMGYKSQIQAAASKYGIDPNLVMAVMSQESAGRGDNPMQVNGVSDPSTSIDKGTSMLADLLKQTGGNVDVALQAYNMGSGYIDFVNKNYGGQFSPASAAAFSNMEKRNLGVSVYGDPNYVNNVLRYYPKSSVAQGGGGNVFANWQNNITSPFGATDGRSTPHGGLDLGVKQGTAVQALAGGKISFIKMDDGGQYDPDHKANSTSGGNELGVTMPNGETYYFAHLSGGINPQILADYEAGKKDTVTAGEWLANSGGTPGLAGSGNDTTGAHLHIGYMGTNGVLKDPSILLKQLGVANGFGGGIGDGDIGTNPFAQGAAQQIEVTVNIQGAGASQLNNMTIAQLQKLIKQTVQAIQAQKVSMNPSIG